MSRTFQNIRLFRDLPVIDNVMVGLHMRHGIGFWPTILRLPVARRSEQEIRKRALENLELLGLARVPTGSSAACPMATSARSSSLGRSRPSRACCCSMSPPPG